MKSRECLNINEFRFFFKANLISTLCISCIRFISYAISTNVDFLYNESICGFVPRLRLQRFLEQP